MKKFVPYRYRLKMIGKIVKAVGCCGTGDGVEVIGELTQISPYAVVQVENRKRGGFVGRQNFMVNDHSLEELIVTETGIEGVTLPV